MQKKLIFTLHLFLSRGNGSFYHYYLCLDQDLAKTGAHSNIETFALRGYARYKEKDFILIIGLYTIESSLNIFCGPPFFLLSKYELGSSHVTISRKISLL